MNKSELRKIIREELIKEGKETIFKIEYVDDSSKRVLDTEIIIKDEENAMTISRTEFSGSARAIKIA